MMGSPFFGCSDQRRAPQAVSERPSDAPGGPAQTAPTDEPPDLTEARRRMIAHDLAGRDITDARVLEAMGHVPRHEFVPPEHRHAAYADRPLPIGHEQTISQPYIVALMTQLVRPQANDRALDVGTGSGYQAAVLAELCKEVYSVEILRPLVEESSSRLAGLGYRNVTVRHADGYRGWTEHAPFDVIVVAAAPDHVPEPLVEQLAPGGRLVIPIGGFFQELLLIEKQANGEVRRRTITGVAFVPMTGEAQRAEEP
ncbi:MAG: protein-L-isoaspartate(D-aspartate) O-methyltransferase [Pirellulales bacterium]|nr:protein-L-isoaspartate(D-aspartate) O-methyltransferase [Pirellulales bacterium]